MHQQPLSKLGDVDVAEFLTDYWQKKPLFTKAVFEGFKPIIDADTLAGLSLEEDIESRLIVEKNGKWELKHGPLEDEDFSTLPEESWTLLVQSLDSIHPDFADLMDAFRFIPNWRLDDIMVSYAAEKGGVGPHFDYYDVLLLQAEGVREWRLGQWCSSKTPLQGGQAMNILTSFDEHDRFIAEPGDLLYVPAGMAHWGIAQGPCQTYSIGFRAPSDSDLLLEFSQYLAAELSEDNRFRDEQTSLINNPARLPDSAIDTLHRRLQGLLANKEALARWLAEFSSQTRFNQGENKTNSGDQEAIPSHIALNRFARCVFSDVGHGKACLAINGESWQCTNDFAERLGCGKQLELASLDQTDKELALSLLQDGWVDSVTNNN